MKMKLFYSCVFACMLSVISSCNDDKETLPPTIEDIVAEYSGANLKTIVNGTDATEVNGKIELVKAEEEGKVNVVLYNIVPRSKKVTIPNVDFSTKTKTSYVSKLVGEVIDYESGYKVGFVGAVDEKTMSAEIMLVELDATDINTLPLHNQVYKGNMEVIINNTPTTSTQRIYVYKSRPTPDKTNRDTSMVKLSIENFNFNGVNIANIDLDTVKVEKRGELYGFEANDRILSIAMGGKFVDVPVKLYGYIVENKMTMNMELDVNTVIATVDFTGESVKENVAARMIKMEISSEGIIDSFNESTKATLKAWEGTPNEKLLATPKYELSEKATIDSIVLTVYTGEKEKTDTKLSNDEITGKKPIDFSPLKSNPKNFIKYFIAGEDTNKKGSYLIYMELIPQPTTKFVFDNSYEWMMVNPGDGVDPYSDPKGWATSNSAAVLLKAFGLYPENTPYPVSKNETYDAKIITVDSKGGLGGMVPATTAGTLFLGKFEIIDPMNPLTSTRFGIPYNAEPKSVKGSYKYTAGAEFHIGNPAKPVPDRKDLCAITAILYEVSIYSETLDGTNFSDSPKIVASASITNGTTEGFIDFDLSMTYLKPYDATKKYKFAFIFSSSKDGAIFEGAPGSELLIKSIEVINK